MIIFLFGEDDFRIREKLKSITEHYKKIHKSGLNLKYLDCNKKSINGAFDQLNKETAQNSMFKEKKLIIIGNPFEDINFKEKFLNIKKDLINSDDIILLYQNGKINQRNSLFSFLKKNAKFQEFKLLARQQLKAWVKKEFEKYNSTISENALNILVENIGNDLWRMSQEINKLINYKGKEKIEEKDIRLLVKPKVETDIFKTIDAISEKNKKHALSLLNKHLRKGDSPLYLLSMINFQIKNLLIVKELIQKGEPFNLVVSKSGLHPFVARKSYFQSQKFTFLELKKIFQNIFKIDLDIKTGRIDPETALNLLVAKI
ncbi:MAG: DNA polymerase III subunit delta [Patescibacteria group bacterium]|nr:DNA polymerase III subunit delta [Patescibacteria group bacterium]